MKKIYDLAVKTGSYTKDGQEKGRYENIGSIVQKDDGSQMMFLNRHINPAGIPFKEGSESILVSMFTPKSVGDKSSPSTPFDDEFTAF